MEGDATYYVGGKAVHMTNSPGRQHVSVSATGWDECREKHIEEGRDGMATASRRLSDHPANPPR